MKSILFFLCVGLLIAASFGHRRKKNRPGHNQYIDPTEDPHANQQHHEDDDDDKDDEKDNHPPVHKLVVMITIALAVIITCVCVCCIVKQQCKSKRQVSVDGTRKDSTIWTLGSPAENAKTKPPQRKVVKVKGFNENPTPVNKSRTPTYTSIGLATYPEAPATYPDAPPTYPEAPPTYPEAPPTYPEAPPAYPDAPPAYSPPPPYNAKY